MPLFKTAKKKGNLSEFGFPPEKPSGMYYPGQTFVQPERLPEAAPTKPVYESLQNILALNTSGKKPTTIQSPTVKNVGLGGPMKPFRVSNVADPNVASTGVSTPASTPKSLAIKVPNTPPSPNVEGVQMPSGWAMRLNDQGQVYFEDLVAGTTQWNFPSNAPLPEGWSEVFNNTKVKYYTHPSQNSSWYRPSANGTRRNKANLGAVSTENIQKVKNLEAKLNNAEKRAANAAKALANAQNKTKRNRNVNLNALRKKLEEAERRAAEAERKLTTASEEKPQLGLAALMAKRAAAVAPTEEGEKPQLGLAAMLAKRAAPVEAPKANNGALPEKYAKMKKVGLPISAIRQKMIADGLDPNKYPQLKEEAVAVVSEDYFLLPPDTNTRFAKYHKLRRAGVSEQNIKAKMKENKNAGILSLEAYNLATKRPAFTKKNRNNRARPNTTEKKPAAMSLVNALKAAQQKRPKANIANIEAALRKGNKKNNTAAGVLGNIRGKLRKTEVKNINQTERVKRMLAEEQSVAAERAAVAEAAAKPTTYTFNDTW
jgi:hypothetical protein